MADPYTYTSVYMQNTFINHVLRASSASASGSAWVGLFKRTGTGSNSDPYVYTELSGSGYSRILTTGSWSISTAGSTWNSSSITFSATAAWGTIARLGIYNRSESSGSLLFTTHLAYPKEISAGDAFYIPPAGITLSFPGGYSAYSASRLINHWLNDNKWTGPSTNVYCALYTTMPDYYGTGGTEVSASAAYARVKVGGTGSWVVPKSGSTSNIYPIVYNTHLDTSEDWGILAGFCLWDGAGVSNLLYRGTIYPRVAVLGPDGFMFDDGDLKVYSDIGHTVD